MACPQRRRMDAVRHQGRQAERQGRQQARGDAALAARRQGSRVWVVIRAAWRAGEPERGVSEEEAERRVGRRGCQRLRLDQADAQGAPLGVVGGGGLLLVRQRSCARVRACQQSEGPSGRGSQHRRLASTGISGPSRRTRASERVAIAGHDGRVCCDAPGGGYGPQTSLLQLRGMSFCGASASTLDRPAMLCCEQQAILGAQRLSLAQHRGFGAEAAKRRSGIIKHGRAVRLRCGISYSSSSRFSFNHAPVGRMAAVLHDQRTQPVNTDCAEFCPHPEHHDVLAVAAYELQEASQQRIGRLDLFRVAGAADDGSCRLQELASCQQVGIFDAKWRCTSSGAQLGLALADGRLSLLEVQVGRVQLPRATAPPRPDPVALTRSLSPPTTCRAWGRQSRSCSPAAAARPSATAWPCTWTGSRQARPPTAPAPAAAAAGTRLQKAARKKQGLGSGRPAAPAPVPAPQMPCRARLQHQQGQHGRWAAVRPWSAAPLAASAWCS